MVPYSKFQLRFARANIDWPTYGRLKLAQG